MKTLHVDEMAIRKAVVFDWGMEGNGERLSQGDAALSDISPS